MVTTYLPIILKEDYEAFQRILHPNLPDTHNEWFYLHAKERADYEGRDQRTAVEAGSPPGGALRSALPPPIFWDANR